jgi:hypothetical protein
MTATPTVTTDAEWARLDDCRTCGVGRGVRCRNKLPGATAERVRPHPVRLPVPDRDADGNMLLGRREHLGTSRPGTTHGAHAHHVSVGETAACSGALLAEETTSVLTRLTHRERCQRPPCKRLWRAEEDRL